MPRSHVRELCFVNRWFVPRALFSALLDFLFIRLLRSQRDSGLHFLCREKVTKSGRGAPRTPVRGDSHPAGGVGPACRSIRGRIRASTGPLVGLALPAPLGQGGGRQPSPPAVRGGIWADPAPLVGVWEMGPKRQPGTVHESSGGPGCRAPRKAFRFAELPTALPGGERRLGTGHETNGGPSRSPPALPFDSEGARGPPRSIFGHFLLTKKVATSASGFCLTRSQTTVLPMAQRKNHPSGTS